MIKIRCLRDVHRGISLKKDKVYEALRAQKGWFALIDETGEDYVYPPDIFEVVEDDPMGNLVPEVKWILE